MGFWDGSMTDLAVVAINAVVVAFGFGTTYGLLRAKIEFLCQRVARIEQWIDQSRQPRPPSR